MGSRIPKPLMDEISKGRATLFLGAGASCEANFPNSGELAQYLLTKAGDNLLKLLNNKDLSTIAEYLYTEPGFGREWVRNNIIKFLEDKQKTVKRPPSNAHELMTLIPWRAIFTTNYDRLIEISYDSSPDCVQTVLPIYEPDAQIGKHEKETIRLIKLNGSVDEASRKSSHDLVITFADQQKARSKNKDFYELLREEAIQGPIIFIGFGFRYPGIDITGTSPEFTTLKDLLQEIGSAYRWHYCVSPYDSSIESELAIRILKANQVEVINSTFGDFLVEVTGMLKGSLTPLSEKPSILVPVSSTSISIDATEYAKDRHHFEIINSQMELSPKPSTSDSLNGSENWSSFFSRHYIDRLCKSDFFEELGSGLSRAPNIISFVASPGWGKTFFLKSITVERYKEEGQPVIWLNPFGTLDLSKNENEHIIAGKWDEKRIDYIVGRINNVAEEHKLKDGKGIPIIIADNCPERVEEVISLFRYLNSNNRKFLILITFRDYEFDIAIEGHALLKRGLTFIPEEKEYDSTDEVMRLIDFCDSHGIANLKLQKEIIAQRIIEGEANRSLILALQIIYDGQHRPFSEIIKSWWDGIDNEIGKDLVLKVSSLHRYGSIFFPRLISLVNSLPRSVTQTQILETYYKKLYGNILFEDIVEEEPCVRTFHSLVALEFTKVCGKNPEYIDDNLIQLVKQMKYTNERDLEIVRRLLKHINYYEINLSTENKIDDLFKIATKSTNDDWVVSHQYSNYLLRRNEYEQAFYWIDRALKRNPKSSTLIHTKGNILRRWGTHLKLAKNYIYSNKKFDDARKCFALSRIGADPSEYGYVTHLDMLLDLIRTANDDVERANLIAEGSQIYNDGVNKVSEERFNLLLHKRFNIFKPTGGKLDTIINKLENGLNNGKASVYGITYLADYYYYIKMDYKKSIDILNKGKLLYNRGILLFVEEAELHTREGNFNEAIKSIDSAKRRRDSAENDEILWKLTYWDLIISFIYEDFDSARKAAIYLNQNSNFPGRSHPKGYIWKKEAKNKDAKERDFKTDAKIFSGRIKDLRGSDSSYGRIELYDRAGRPIYIQFNKKYFSRGDLRPGQHIKFVLAFLSDGLRAENIDSKPFITTTDDVFI